jgi:hypothetical protein
MKASRAIEMLKGYKPDEEIYIMWWDSDIVEMFSEKLLTEDNWNQIVDSLENNEVGSEEVTDYIISEVEDEL